MTGATPKLSRRRLFHAGAGAAVLAGLPAALGGIAGAKAASPAPTTAQPVTTLIVQPWRYDGSKVLTEIMGANLSQFEAQHPGVHVKMTVGEKPSIPALIAGNAPDVIQANDEMPYLPSGMILPLDPYIRADNVDMTVWPALQINNSRWNGGIHGLPSYFNMVVMMANLGAFDEMGLAYPTADWTQADFARTAVRMTATQGKTKRYGAALLWTADGPTDMEYILEGFGSGLMDATDTVCRLGESAAVTAGQWVYQDLLWPGAATTNNVLGAVVSGSAAVGPTRPDQLVFGENVVTAAAKLKWDFLPMPQFPHGRATNAPAQYYMINTQTKSAQLAWELVKWITYAPSWQRMMMQLALIPPALISLATEWEATVRAVAPPMKTKALQWFGDSMRNNYAYPYRYFTYSDSQAKSVLSSYTQKLGAHRADVAQAFAQAAGQVNALETTGATVQGEEAVLAKAFPTNGPAIAAVHTGI